MTRPDPMTEEEQQALLDAVADQDAPWWLEEGDPGPQEDPPPEDCGLAEIAAQCRQIAEDQARAAANAAGLGATGALAAIGAARRGPGQARVGPPLPRRVPQPGSPVRHRDADGCDAGPARAGRVRR